ncbi:hypothetical protein AGDE_01703 [Angomonas deanei]|nr:hypothetical protein AGDE_01703 [Angomonas deanei]|eukprot:EPY42220.1 hypothetical protein AGDE_01703 [Angomonas deanei]
MTESEQSWRLLFDIALSHGESLATSQLTFNGLDNMLRGSKLLGAKCGIYPEYVERLWERYSQPLVVKVVDHSLDDREYLYTRGTLKFSGFSDIMNLLSVRCYQTHLSSKLMKQGTEDLKEIISLSAESKVNLRESVEYTAKEYLKSYVYAHTVHKRSIIRLRPELNGWPGYIQSVVTHLIASYEASVIVPLFSRFSTQDAANAGDGILSKERYLDFLDVVFGDAFTPIQQTSAMAIFDYNQFTRTSDWLDCSMLERNVEFDKALKLSITEKGKIPPMLSLENFVDVLLLLSVVAFSDTRVFPHHRTICAKVWSLFELYLCPAVQTEQLAVDPVLTGYYKNVKPAVSFLYPSRVPIEIVSSFLLSGFALQWPSSGETEESFSAASPPRIINRDLAKAVAQRRAAQDEILRRAYREEEPEMTFSVAERAAKLFSDQFDTSHRAKYEDPASVEHTSPCALYMNETHIGKYLLCDESHVEFEIPPTFRDINGFRIAVNFVEKTEKGTYSFVFTPVDKVTLALRDPNDPRKEYGTTDLVLMSTSVQQMVDLSAVNLLRSVFNEEVNRSKSEEVEEASPKKDESFLTLESFTNVCQTLRIVNHTSTASASLSCQAAADYYLAAKEAAGDRRGRSSVDVRQKIHFNTFVCLVVEVILIRTGASANDIPDVSHLLQVALTSYLDSLGKNGEGASKRSVMKVEAALPYNGRIDVPYQQSLHRRNGDKTEMDQRREELIQKIVSSRKEKSKTLHCILPPFPATESDANSLSPFHPEEESDIMKKTLNDCVVEMRNQFLNEAVQIRKPDFQKMKL